MMASKTILTPGIPKQSSFTTDTPFIGCRRDALLMPEAVDWSKIDQRPIKISITPLVNPKNLEDVFASRVPVLGCGLKNLLSGTASEFGGIVLNLSNRKQASSRSVVDVQNVYELFIIFAKCDIHNICELPIPTPVYVRRGNAIFSLILGVWPLNVWRRFVVVNRMRKCRCDKHQRHNHVFHFCAEKDERDVETVAVSRRTCLPCSTNSWLDCSIHDRCPMTASRPSKAAPVASAVRMPAYTYIPIENMKIEANAFSSAGSIVGVKVAYSAIPSARIPPIMKIRPVTFSRIRSSVITNLFELMLRYETNKGGSHCNTRYTGGSYCFRKAVSHFLQGGGGQSTPCKRTTLKSKYAIINSILRDQVDRSEA